MFGISRKALSIAPCLDTPSLLPLLYTVVTDHAKALNVLLIPKELRVSAMRDDVIQDSSVLGIARRLRVERRDATLSSAFSTETVLRVGEEQFAKSTPPLCEVPRSPRPVRIGCHGAYRLQETTPRQPTLEETDISKRPRSDIFSTTNSTASEISESGHDPPPTGCTGGSCSSRHWGPSSPGPAGSRDSRD